MFTRLTMPFDYHYLSKHVDNPKATLGLLVHSTKSKAGFAVLLKKDTKSNHIQRWKWLAE